MGRAVCCVAGSLSERKDKEHKSSPSFNKPQKKQGSVTWGGEELLKTVDEKGKRWAWMEDWWWWAVVVVVV